MNITNDIITAYLDSLYSCKNEDLARLRAYGEEHIIPIILKSTEDFLRVILNIHRPERILEIGTAIGYSACFFTSTLPCHVTSIESDEQMCETARFNIRQLGFEDSIDVIHGDGLEVLQKLRQEMDDSDHREDLLYDMVFIDAAKSHYHEFWDAVRPMCRKGAMIICDNVLMRGTTASDIYDPKNKHRTSIRHMREFISYINQLEHVETSVLAIGDGVSISILDTDNE